MAADGNTLHGDARLSAPYFEAMADGPAGGSAHWLETRDGVRIRAVTWGADAPGGTILLFPGRTEYAEKYGRAATQMYARGYATVAVDWRGQGLAARLLDNRAIGHVGRFLDYQHDVDALVAHVRDRGLPEPYYLLAHSMGGCIGLRSLCAGLPVVAAGFTAPMWGITMAPRMRPVAWALSSLSRHIGQSGRQSPGQQDETYVLRAPFAGNALTTDADMWAWMQDQLRAQPDLALGGASLGWLNEALREMRALSRLPSPDLPCLTALGTAETIVDPARIHSRMAAWRHGELWLVEGAAHEIMMEKTATRNGFFDRLATVYAQARG